MNGGVVKGNVTNDVSSARNLPSVIDLVLWHALSSDYCPVLNGGFAF